MRTVELQLEDWILEFVTSFGNLDEIMHLALKKYLIDKTLECIEPLKRSIVKWEIQYSMPYDAFHAKVIDDQAFLRHLNQTHPMWEADLLE